MGKAIGRGRLINPIPCTPFPLLRGRGEDLKEGLAPLLNAPYFARREASPLLSKLFSISLKG